VEGLKVSHQLNAALDDLSKVMSQLRTAVKGIPVRREGFKALHDAFARSTARLVVETSYARSQLAESSTRSRRR
jgi:hypothetical protein